MVGDTEILLAHMLVADVIAETQLPSSFLLIGVKYVALATQILLIDPLVLKALIELFVLVLPRILELTIISSFEVGLSAFTQQIISLKDGASLTLLSSRPTIIVDDTELCRIIS
jgi:hypothetical protein